jgi:hypothetical protein
MTTRRLTHNDPFVDPAHREMMHSLFDGRATYKADQSSDAYHADMPKHERKQKITLATLAFHYLR